MRIYIHVWARMGDWSAHPSSVDCNVSRALPCEASYSAPMQESGSRPAGPRRCNTPAAKKRSIEYKPRNPSDEGSAAPPAPAIFTQAQAMRRTRILTPGRICLAVGSLELGDGLQLPCTCTICGEGRRSHARATSPQLAQAQRLRACTQARHTHTP